MKACKKLPLVKKKAKMNGNQNRHNKQDFKELIVLIDGIPKTIMNFQILQKEKKISKLLE